MGSVDCDWLIFKTNANVIPLPPEICQENQAGIR